MKFVGYEGVVAYKRSHQSTKDWKGQEGEKEAVDEGVVLRECVIQWKKSFRRRNYGWKILKYNFDLGLYFNVGSMEEMHDKITAI